MPATAALCTSAMTTIYVTVESFGRELVGRLSTCRGEVRFRGLTHMLLAMEQIYDGLSMPQATFGSRTFLLHRKTKTRNPAREQPQMKYEMPQAPQSEQATFIIRVKYRQNATWQGEITWVGKGQTQFFRSDLEMLKLMDEALNREFPQREDIKWENGTRPEPLPAEAADIQADQEQNPVQDKQ